MAVAKAVAKPMTREDVTDLIYSAKVQKGIKWADVSKKLKLSKEWTTAACLGQMTLTKAQATIIGKTFGLPAEAVALLQVVPYKGSWGFGANRSADLSLVRNRQRLWHDD